MFKIFLTVLCFISYGTAIRLFSQENSLPKISEPSKIPQCICTDGATLKSFTPNDDKFGLLNNVFPKEPANPFTAFFDTMKAPETKGSLLETIMRPFENMFPTKKKQNDIFPDINDVPQNLFTSLFQIPKQTEIKMNPDNEQTHIPDHICSSVWPNAPNFVQKPEPQKSPISIHITKVPTPPSPYGVLNRPNFINSGLPPNKNINQNYGNAKQVKIGATINPNTGINFPNLSSVFQGAPQNFENMFNGLANLNPFSGLSMPNFNLGAGFNFPNLGAGLAGALSNPFNINAGLKMPNLGNGLNNIKPSFLGANLNVPGLNSNLNLGLNPNLNFGLNPNLNLGIPGLNLGASLNGVNYNGQIGMNPTVESPQTNFLSSIPKDEPNTSITRRFNFEEDNAVTSEGTSAPNAEISTSTAGDPGVPSTNTQNAPTNVNINNNEVTQENSMASPTAQAQPQNTSSANGIAPEKPNLGVLGQGQTIYQPAPT